MTVRGLVKMLRRRWPLAVVVGLLVLAAGGSTAVSNGPTYTYTSSTVLLPPSGGAEGTGNPYLNMGSLSAAADVIITSLQSTSVADTVQKSAPGVEFGAAKDPLASAPFIQVTATGSDPATARRALDELTSMVPQRLTDLQDASNVSQNNRITARLVSKGDTPVVSQRARYRSVLLAVVATGILGAAAIVGIDLLLTRRARSQGRRRGPSSSQAPPGPGAPPAEPRPSDRRRPPPRSAELEDSPVGRGSR